MVDFADDATIIWPAPVNWQCSGWSAGSQSPAGKKSLRSSKPDARGYCELAIAGCCPHAANAQRCA